VCVLCPSRHKRSSRSQSRTIVLVSISNGTCKYILGQSFWFGLLVLLNLGVCLFIDSFVCYYCLFVKTQGEHPSTQYLLGQSFSLLVLLNFSVCHFIDYYCLVKAVTRPGHLAAEGCWGGGAMDTNPGLAQANSSQLLSTRKTREGFYLAEGSYDDIVSQ
jgi:hypothetical protein